MGKRFCWHKWLPWSDPIVTYNSGHKQQWRVCEGCNKAQFRTLWWDKQTCVANVVKAITATRILGKSHSVEAQESQQ